MEGEPPAVMTERFQEFLRLMRALADDSVESVLVGGLTTSAFGVVSATEEIVLFVRPEASNLARLRSALFRVWADPGLDEIRDEDFSAIRYLPPTGSFTVDLITRFGSDVLFESLEGETLAVGGVPMRIATPATLDRMRRAAAPNALE